MLELIFRILKKILITLEGLEMNSFIFILMRYTGMKKYHENVNVGLYNILITT